MNKIDNKSDNILSQKAIGSETFAAERAEHVRNFITNNSQ